MQTSCDELVAAVVLFIYFHYNVVYIFDLRKLMLFVITDLSSLIIENIEAGDVIHSSIVIRYS